MIEAHTLDAWTRAADRSSLPYGYLMVLGGFAAPLFLWLAGVGLAFSAEQVVARTGDRLKAGETIVRRGAEIFILAFLFRIQAYVVSPGSYLVTLFRVDILNVMGPAIVFSGIVWSLARGRRAAVLSLSVVAGAIAMGTPLIRTAHWVAGLPTWVQWYLRPAADNTTFMLFPWAGFVFAGAAYGTVLAGARDAAAERRVATGLAAAGALVMALGFYTSYRPALYPVAAFWTSSPTYFAIRVGAMIVALAALRSVATWRALPDQLAFLEKFGRNSLFIYWIHVELVYGYASWAIHRRLPLWGTLVGLLLFATLMYGAIPLRDRIVAVWNARRSQKSASERAVTARA